MKGVVKLFAKVTFDGNGVATVVTPVTDPSLAQNPSAGFVGEVVTSAGNPATYTIKLQDSYVRLLGVRVTASDIQGNIIPVTALVDNSADVAAAAPKLALKFLCYDVQAAAVAPGQPKSCTVLLEVALANSSAL